MGESENDDTERDINPLGLPLHKSQEPTAAKTKGQSPQDAIARINLQIDKRIDAKLAAYPNTGKRSFPLWHILFVIFLSPFLINIGSDLYNFTKTNILEIAGDKNLTFGLSEDAKKTAPLTFSIKYEKKKLLEIAGIDIDDPIKNTMKIRNIDSIKTLNQLKVSFNRILTNAKEHKISDFHIQSAKKGKRQAEQRLKELNKNS
jgi:hypothetical protein